MLRSLLCALFMLVTLSAQADDERRFALVIGNATYENVATLENPIHDATDLAATLTKIGFEVRLGLDLNREQLQSAIADFANTAKNADLSLIYFAGHGIELDQTNFLIPVDAKLEKDNDAEDETVALDSLMASVAEMRGIKLVLIDACRTNPFAERLRQNQPTRSIGTGLVRVDPRGGALPDGVLIGYAAKEGTVAFDGLGRNSPYANGLLQHMEEPGLEIGKLFRKVRDSVFKQTQGAQQPFTYGSLPSTDIFLVPALDDPEAETSHDRDNVTKLSAAFVRADRLNTVINWENFINKHADEHADNVLLKSAQRRLELLRKNANRQESGPWLETTYDDSGEAILTAEQTELLQASLVFSGFDPGPSDGSLGPRTRRAVFAARARYGLSIGDSIDEKLLRSLVDPRPVLQLQSDVSRQYTPRNIPEGLEPRLKRVMETLSRYHYVFGYFEGRLYVVVRNDNSSPSLKMSWEMASQLAQAAGGYLATVSTSEENDFIYGLFSTDPKFVRERQGNVHGPGFGLIQITRSSEPFGGWSWINGEELSFTNWAPGQPNNENGEEHYGEYFAAGRQTSGQSGPKYWNDVSVGAQRGLYARISGFVFEFD
ncbi:MAG: caspase family protein [Roseibium sp.]|uniref:caspase family protein n=1 Tax=Roseibium sp. TaxID=1936156 RepID=UPI003D9C2141